MATWWSSFKHELAQYVAEGCPPADSTVLGQKFKDANIPIPDSAEKLDRAHMDTLSKHIRWVIIESCRENSLLEPFARDVLGAKATARQVRLWKDKAVMAVFYRCSFSIQQQISPVTLSMATRMLTAESQHVLEGKGFQFAAEPLPSAPASSSVSKRARLEKPPCEKSLPPQPSPEPERIPSPEKSPPGNVRRTDPEKSPVSEAASSARAPKSIAGSGRRRELCKNLEDMITAHCKTDVEVHETMHNLENRLQKHFPDLSFHSNLACLPATSLWFLKHLGELRKDAVDKQTMTISIDELDKAISDNGRIELDWLSKNGYHIGARMRKRLFDEDALPRQSGGRPSKVNDASLVEIARSVLGRHSKAGSRIVTVERTSHGYAKVTKNKDGAESIPSVSLLVAPQHIYDMEPDLQRQMSSSTFLRMLRGHFGEFRKSGRATDVCHHCVSFHEKIVPAFRRFRDQTIKALEEVMPSYFDAWESSEQVQTAESHGDWALAAEELLKFARSHNRKFGAKRRTELSLADQITLYSEVEAPAELDLKAHKQLLQSYQWHMMSAQRQHDSLMALTSSKASTLPVGDTLLCFDWREKLRVPMAPQETGAMWHAAQKNAVSCWGGAVYKHSASSTAESPLLDVTFIFFCTSIIEQTAEASNKMLSKALELAKVSRSGCLWLWSDVGPHFRSAENAFFYLRHLPKTRQQPVKVRYLAECHGKGVLDAMFAVTGCSKSGWIGRYAAKHQIDNVKDIVKALKLGASEQRAKDPAGPQWLIQEINYGERKSQLREFLYADSVKITRTYAMDAEPYKGRAQLPPIWFNRIFDDCQHRTRVSDWRVEFLKEDNPEQWRQGSVDVTRALEEADPHKDSQLKQKFESQKNAPCPRALFPQRTFEDKIQRQQQRQEKANIRLKQKQERFRKIRKGELLPSDAKDSSDSENTSSTDSESESAG